MRRDVDFSTPTGADNQPSKVWFWRWAAGGIGAVMILAVIHASVWVFALLLMVWVSAGALWFVRDVDGRMRQSIAHGVNPQLGSIHNPVQGAAWQDWVAGWYWETDSQHRLQVFKPGAGQVQNESVDWVALASLVAQQPIWWSCWDIAGDLPASNSPLARFQYALLQRQAWPDALVLPWPAALRSVLAAPVDEATCALRARLVWAADGTFAGYQGVLVPLWPAVAKLDEPVQVDAVQAHPMSDAEQEVLRYALSHDLRAPLRVVDGFTRIIKEDYGHLLDKLGNDHLDRVLSASSRMNGMIDAILAQAQLAGTPLDRTDIDVSTLAREVGAEMVSFMPQCVQAEVLVCEDMVTQADPVLVRRVLENLIGNALKYSAKVSAPRVEVGAMPLTNPAVFYVKDNGAGFDMQHADKLFGLFQRLHSAKEFPGTGVGLAGVQNIIRRHGGRVWAEARPGEGACFYFTLMDIAEAQQRAGRSQ
jgi:signal transduction histidine kinase